MTNDQVQPELTARVAPGESVDHWRRRAIWAENRLGEIERELVDVGRRRFGAHLVWRWRALLPATWSAIDRHRDRDAERRLMRQRARRRARGAR